MTRLDPFHPLHPELQDRLQRVPAGAPGHHNMMLLHLGAAADMASGLSLEDIPMEDTLRALPDCIHILGEHLVEVRYMEAHSLGDLRKERGAVHADHTANVTGGKGSAFTVLCASQLSTSSPDSIEPRMRRVSKYNTTKYSPEDNIPVAEALHIGLVHEEDIDAVLQDSHRILPQAAVRRTGDVAEVRRSSLTFLLEIPWKRETKYKP